MIAAYRNAKVFELQSWRAYLVLCVLAGLLLLLIGRAAYLMGYKEDFLRGQGEARFKRKLNLEANRGMITDRHGEPLAISTPVASIWASPSEMPRPKPEQIKLLASVLNLPVEEVGRKLADTRRDFVFLRRQISPDAAQRVLGLGIPGISKQTEYRRYYPAGEVTAHILGFTDIDNKGQEGFELTRESMLAGKPGSRQVIRDARGYVVEDITSIEKPRDGETLTLSIDRKIQYLAFRELKTAVETFDAKGGAIVVLNAQTGEVLALANFPTYNPNNRVKLDPAARRNRAVTDLYEPGSTMKSLTVSAVLESGKATPKTQVSTGGAWVFQGAPIRDTHNYGTLDVWGVIQKSSNIGTAKLGLELPREYLWNFYDSLGIGELPHTGFPGEASGRLRPWKSWRPIEQATMSYGYGMSVSLIQMAKAYQIFATDGEIRPVTFQRQVAPLPGRRVVSAEVAQTMRLMLERVTQPGGTATRAQVLGYRVGGKTGTSKKLVGGAYSSTAHVGSFVGLAPLSNPRLIVAVMIDEPNETGGRPYYGGLVAAPTFATVMAGSLRMLGVPPDAPLNNILLPSADEPEIKEET